MHPTAELKAAKRRLDTLEAELAELRRLVPKPPVQPEGPTLPPTCYVDEGNLVRTASGVLVGRLVNGEFAPFPSEEEQEAAYQDRIVAARREREQEAEAEKERKFWVDPSGYRRGLDGRNLGRDSVLRAAEAAKAAAVAAKAAAAA